jgi:hypothetical protein
MNGEADAVGLEDHHALAGLSANEFLHSGFMRIDLGNHTRDGLGIEGIFEDEESFLIEGPRLYGSDSSKGPNDRPPLKASIERMKVRFVRVYTQISLAPEY